LTDIKAIVGEQLAEFLLRQIRPSEVSAQSRGKAELLCFCRRSRPAHASIIRLYRKKWQGKKYRLTRTLTINIPERLDKLERHDQSHPHESGEQDTTGVA
jgi:hypothetical protein